jgi:hypothetical protein
MTDGQETLLAIVIAAIAISAAYGWFSDKSKRLKEDEFNRNLRKQLQELRVELETRETYLTNLQTQFAAGISSGRNWLAKFLAEADRVLDESISKSMRDKPRPAYKAAEEVAVARAERRLYKERVKFLEYQLASLKEYFPFLEEYEDIILDEAVSLDAGNANLANLEESDPVLRFVTKADYERLSPGERNQLALNRYLNANLGPAAIGRLYERYLGYLYECDGWQVEYHGIVKGLEDLGRDLICSKGNEIKIIQAKCWSSAKLIHEKHVFQLFGTTQLYLMNRVKYELFAPSISARFVTTTSLSPVARQAAEWLKIEVEEQRPLSKAFPMIKCNINQTTREKIYHLPFDQQYDRTKIIPEFGELYAFTTEEAERKGFRRAFRFSGMGR